MANTKYTHIVIIIDRNYDMRICTTNVEGGSSVQILPGCCWKRWKSSKTFRNCRRSNSSSITHTVWPPQLTTLACAYHDCMHNTTVFSTVYLLLPLPPAWTAVCYDRTKREDIEAKRERERETRNDGLSIIWRADGIKTSCRPIDVSRLELMMPYIL